jgi:hypothetical protein
MQVLTPDLFDRIASIDDGLVVSIHLPTERAGRETEKGRIHLKNGIERARNLLEGHGFEREEIDRRLKVLESLTEDHGFWQQQREGLSVFQYDDEHIEVSLETRPESLVQVGTRAHVVPLAAELGTRRSVAVLVLSSNRVALFGVQGESIEEIDVPDLPKDYEELGRYIDEESQLQFHSGSSRGAAGSSNEAIYHGHGVGTESDTKVRLEEFSRLIDDRVAAYLRNGSGLPLVVIAAEPLHTIYRDANSYEHLIETEAGGNADHMSGDQILKTARKLCDAAIGSTKDDVLADMKERLGSDGVLFELEDVLEAAADGKLQRLVGASDRPVWGKADLANAPRAVDAHEERLDGDEDLQNLAFVTAQRTGAALYAFPAEAMPEGRTLLGLRRF